MQYEMLNANSSVRCCRRLCMATDGRSVSRDGGRQGRMATASSGGKESNKKTTTKDMK